MTTELTPDEICGRCSGDPLNFTTTLELPSVVDIPGQARAREAVEFAASIRSADYNLFVLGPSGYGKHEMVKRSLTRRAADEPAPSDWCYVNRWDDLRRPLALALPAGRGRQLRDDVSNLLAELKLAVPAAFASEEHRHRVQRIAHDLERKHEEGLDTLRQRARERRIAILTTPSGFALAPLEPDKDEVIPPEQLQSLPEQRREELRIAATATEKELEAFLQQLPQWQREARERKRELDRELTKSAVSHLVDEVVNRYRDLPEVQQWLAQLGDDVLAHADLFRVDDEAPDADVPLPLRDKGAAVRRRYGVNLLVDNRRGRGAPLIHEGHPILDNLVGRIEHRTELGTRLTDVTLISSGAFHRANGGYLVLDAHRLLMHPFAWEALKRILLFGEIRIESVERMSGLLDSEGIEPDPIPFQGKVVLFGERRIYYLLCELDPEFLKLFKIAADFEDEMERTPDNAELFSRLLATFVRKHGFRHLHHTAVARLLEEASRIAGDQHKLTLHLQKLTDLVRESDAFAALERAETIERPHVERAIAAKIRRSSRLRDRTLDALDEGAILVAVTGQAIGQVNGLSVSELGGFAWGRPVRISASVAFGKGEIVDIEREVKLGGPIHSKGVLILTGILTGRYCSERPLGLSARIVFEQSYGAIEGDSASLAELCALLSAIVRTPLRQDLAVTGSINQLGEVQPIGGVNEKIEGFYDACARKGRVPTQGVIIPRANVRHLMLRCDIVEAVREGRFHVHAVTHVDEALALLVGTDAETFNARVAEQLERSADRLERFAHGENKPAAEQRLPHD